MADPECRPWLLILWTLSWRNIPCGTWEDDPEFIAAAIGCKFEWFSGHKNQLLRGWTRHSDGLLYHSFITKQVHDMLGRRTSSTDRVRKYRELQAAKKAEKQEATWCNVLHSVTYAKDQEQEQDQVKARGASAPGPTFVPKAEPDAPPAEASLAENTPVQRIYVPYAKIRELWCETLPSLRKPLAVEHWTDNRKAVIRARWQDQLPDLDAWKTTFNLVAQSRFLTGQASPSPGRRPFECDLFWLCKPENLLKLYEGRYNDG